MSYRGYRFREDEAYAPYTEWYFREDWFNPDNPSQSIEPSEGVYNWSRIDWLFARAEAAEKIIVMRVPRYMHDSVGGKVYVPEYVRPFGSVNANNTWVPNLKSKVFRVSYLDMLRKFGQRYGNNIGWLEIGLQEWGEGSGIPKDTPEEFLKELIDGIYDAFKYAPKVIQVKTLPVIADYCYKLSPEAGWKVDNLGGDPTYFDSIKDYLVNREGYAEWKAFEKTPSIQAGMDQIDQYNITHVAMGPLKPFAQYSQAEQTILYNIASKELPE